MRFKITIKHQTKLPQSSWVLSYMLLKSICYFLLSNKQCDKCCHEMSDIAPSVTPALVAGLKTGCRYLGSSVYLLHSSRWLSLKAE